LPSIAATVTGVSYMSGGLALHFCLLLSHHTYLETCTCNRGELAAPIGA
jgi:hypothetical protein